MKKKDIIFKLLYGLAWIFIIFITIIVFLGKAATRDIYIIVIFYILHGIMLLLRLAYEMAKLIYSYETDKFLSKALIYLKAIHKARYKLYFSEDKDLVEEYSVEIQRQGTAMINLGEDAILSNLLTKKHRNNIEEIIIQTKKLMTTDR